MKSGTAKGAEFEIRRTQRKRRTDTEEIRRDTEGHREEVSRLLDYPFCTYYLARRA
jgi:hypothetical protein